MSVHIGIITTHPIQYQAPLFRELRSRDELEVTVYFRHLPDPERQGKGFSVDFSWDLPLLEGYSWKVSQKYEEAEGRRTDLPTFPHFTAAYREVDVMLIHGWQSAYMRRAWWTGIRSNVPVMVRGESNAMKDRPWYIRALHRMYLKAFDRYLYIGESNKEFYQNAGVSSEDLYPARYCVENDRFDRDWQEYKGRRKTLRQDLGVDETAVCFIFCGKFIEKKRPTDVVEGFLEASDRSDRPMHLLMVGDGELQNGIQERVPVSAPVTFTGFLNQTEIGKAYAAADALVLPSNYGETWGLVVNEGMVFEMPAIVSDRVGCGPDLVEDGKTGFVVPFGCPPAIASAMVRIAEQPDEMQKMGERARRRVTNKYTIEKAVDGIVCAATNAV